MRRRPSVEDSWEVDVRTPLRRRQLKDTSQLSFRRRGPLGGHKFVEDSLDVFYPMRSTFCIEECGSLSLKRPFGS